MSKKKLRLTEDPRWVYFVETFAGDPARFAVEVQGIQPTPQQFELYAEVAPSRSRVSVASGHGCFAAGTLIMRSNGEAVAVENIDVGDRLMGADGNSVRTVQELKRGKEEMYRFTYSDGSSHVFNESHILCLVATNSKGKRVAGDKLNVTVREWLSWGADRKRCHAIYRSEVTQFERENVRLPIPAYDFGAMICDRNNIPNEYLFASKGDRLELLAGLIDTDGSRDGTGFDFVQKREKLARQVVWLARSVGCHATIKEVTKRCGNNGKSGQYWRVTIGRNADQIPVRIARKKLPEGNRQRRNLHFGIKSCEPLGEGSYFGFTVDGDHRILGHDFTVLHNTGKTTGIANICLWHMLCYPESITLVTANDMDQLKATLWKEIGLAVERIRRGKHGWIADHIEVLANASARIRGFNSTWFIESKTANRKTANKMAGRHGTWFMIIADECSTIDDEVMTTLRGALTEQHNRMLLTSQSTRNAGFFYRTHHDLARTNGGEWANLTFSSIDSPLVSDASLISLWNSYDDDERRVRILGQFPQDSSKHMMSLADAEKMYKVGRIIKPDEVSGWIVTADVASGEGLRDKSAIVICKVSGYGDRGVDARKVEVRKIPIFTNGIRSNRIAAAIIEAAEDSCSNPTLVVDSGGLGITVCQDLEDMNRVVHRVNWGNPCFQRKNLDRYLNLRAQATHQAARAAKEGRLSILTTDHKGALLAQASRIPKTFTDKGRIRVPPKHSLEWDGMGSPDLWDAICFAFLEGVTFIADNEDLGENETALSAIEQAASLFDDVG
ncbi:MAG: Hint domain-containing homing endonuclease [Enterovibrio sp.]